MTRKANGFFEQELPLLESMVRRTGLSLTPAWVRAANQELERWCKNKSDAAVQYLRERDFSPSNEDSNEPVVVRAILSGIDREDENHGEDSVVHTTAIRQPELSVASEVFNHILAGQETTGVSMTYLSWHLSQSLELQGQLRQELRAAFPSLVSVAQPGAGDQAKITVPDAKQLDALPILHSVIMETLRRYAPAGGPEPRVVPDPSCSIAGHDIPGGTRISASVYSVHRIESAYSDPLRWDHTRWLNSDSVTADGAGQGETANRHFWGFSSGGRMCLGSNFAMHGEAVSLFLSLCF